MDTSNVIKECTKRILISRMRIILKNPFYGLLLMNMDFGIDDTQPTAYTNGDKICFNTSFMADLTDDELDFILMHEILHVVLRHCQRGKDLNQIQYNVACDIVVNSNIMKSCDDNLKAITLAKYGESMHIAPDKKEGYNYTAEEVYNMLDKESLRNYVSDDVINSFDNHDNWPKEGDGDQFSEDVWIKRVQDAVTSVKRQQSATGRGNVPQCAERMLEELNNPQIDWRTVLNNFISEEVNDYSFSPPDKRYCDDFFIPDFNGTEVTIKNILFMIDTSGSMSERDVKEMYSEVKGAIDQYNGQLQGYLGFFDTEVVEPKQFNSEEEFKIIKAYGGGGTSFVNVFNYINKKMEDNMPTALIMLTDGYAPFPKKEKAPDIPILWVLNNKVVKPPFGKVITVKTKI